VTPVALRNLRRGLLASVCLVGVGVAWSLRRPAASVPPSPEASAKPEAARTEKLYLRRFKGDREVLSVTAREQTGQEHEEQFYKGVEATFAYTSQGQPSTGKITADKGHFTPATTRILFEGNVHVFTGDGFELTTESLIFRGDKNIAKTDAPVGFSRKALRGTARGLVYGAEEGLLELPADVVVNVQEPGEPASQIRAGRATVSREDKTLHFEGGVTVTQAGDLLKAKRFEMEFGEDQTIQRAHAIGDVDWRSAGGAPPGTAAPPANLRGPRHLTARKLDLWFVGNGRLREATAGPDASLTIAPRTQAEEERRLKAKYLTFRFDDQGRTEGLLAFKDVFFDTTPPAGGGQQARSVSCTRLDARMNPVTGDPTVIEFKKSVVFRQGSRHASSQSAYYDGARSTLFLMDDPELVDEAEKSHLSAKAIDLAVRTGDLVARQAVRHLVEARPGNSHGFMGDQASPFLVTSRSLEYTAATRTARYREEALARSGKDEIRAAEIQLQESDQMRRLDASGGVTSVLHGTSKTGDTKPSPIEARSKEMHYDEKGREVVYRGEVSIRQGQVTMRSPQAVMALSADGGAVEKLEAGEPVEVEQGDRKAVGRHGTYTPDTETMVLVGEKVRLTDPKQEIEGRSLTFRVGDDRILVDGQEQVRTQTVIKSRKEPPKP
jgi:lipopolysaccharide transport protein LptA/LPS export ABC transporter protein LptC